MFSGFAALAAAFDIRLVERFDAAPDDVHVASVPCSGLVASSEVLANSFDLSLALRMVLYFAERFVDVLVDFGFHVNDDALDFGGQVEVHVIRVWGGLGHFFFQQGKLGGQVFFTWQGWGVTT